MPCSFQPCLLWFWQADCELYACEPLNIDGVQIHTSQREGVRVDGIDPNGCKDVRISNSTIETGDDAIVFYSSTVWGPALPCENITSTNCRLSSFSSAVLDEVDGARISNSKVPPDTQMFLRVTGRNSRRIHLYNNELNGSVPYRVDSDVEGDTVKAANNL